MCVCVLPRRKSNQWVGNSLRNSTSHTPSLARSLPLSIPSPPLLFLLLSNRDNLFTATSSIKFLLQKDLKKFQSKPRSESHMLSFTPPTFLQIVILDSFRRYQIVILDSFRRYQILQIPISITNLGHDVNHPPTGFTPATWSQNQAPFSPLEPSPT